MRGKNPAHLLPRPSAGDMNQDQQSNLVSTADAIGNSLSLAWNYIATLRALQKQAQPRPELVEHNNHFFYTVTQAMWDALFMKLSHCSDDSKKGKTQGFPKLFKQLKAYVPDDRSIQANVKKQVSILNSLDARLKVESWRHKVLAHNTREGFSVEFYERNKCTLDEVEKLVGKYQCMLHAFTLPLLNLGFKIRDHGPRAHRGVKKLFKELETGRTTACTR